MRTSDGKSYFRHSFESVEKTYRFPDYYAVATALGALIALTAFLLGRPEPICAAIGIAIAVAIFAGLFELTCGFLRTYTISDEKLVSHCLGKAVVLAERANVRKIVVENGLVYSRLIIVGKDKPSRVEAPGYIVEKLGRDLSAWWEKELEERWRPLLLIRSETYH